MQRALLSLPIRRSMASVATSTSSIGSQHCLVTPSRWKGDFAGNTFHNSNPQHGAAYDQAERKLRDDEVEDFLKSVKGWDHNPNTDAIKKTFVFADFEQSYEFMGRLFAFSWALDKYTPVTWHGTKITIELYSAHFKGLSKREVKLAAFCNDHFNMIRKSREQIDKLKMASVTTAIEEAVGADVRVETQARDKHLFEPTPESQGELRSWKDSMGL